MKIVSYGMTSYKITLEAGEELIIDQEDGHRLEVKKFQSHIDVKEKE